MKILVLDLDGTLFDTRQDIADAVNYARRHSGLAELTVPQVTNMVGHGMTVLAQRAFDDSSVDSSVAKTLIMDYYKLHHSDKAKLYPGVRRTLPQIDLIRTIVSNKPKILVDALLEKHEISQYFDFVAGGDTFRFPKPDPGAIHFLLERYQALPSEILVAGDHTPDILMAKRAAVKSVFCTYGFFGKDEIGADFEIDSFPEILKILALISREG